MRPRLTRISHRLSAAAGETARPGKILGLTIALTVLAVALPWSSHAAWRDVVESDIALDLPGARRAALATVREAPRSADAVAAAGWWLENLEVVPEPDEILSAAVGDRDPELGFLLARIDGQLRRRPPRGVPRTVDLSGPFGVFDTLGLVQRPFPEDAALPPPGTPWRGPSQVFRLSLRMPEGTVRPPKPFAVSGVYVAAWKALAPKDLDGWLVVEARGDYHLEIDGRDVAAEKACGRLGAGIHWYRLQLARGGHRIRLAMGSHEIPEVRISLLDGVGDALQVTDPGSGFSGPWAGSRIRAAMPPAEEAFNRAVGDPPSDEQVLLGAELAHVRRDSLAERRWLERARAPLSPELQLALATYFLTEPTGAAEQVDYRRSREHLEKCASLPLGLLVKRILDVRQRRQQDAETVLDELVDRFSSDPRVLRLWIEAAIRRGWVREAEEALGRLRAQLPGSAWVSRLELGVDRALERWSARNRVLKGVAESDPLAPDTVDLLASAGRTSLALEVVETQRKLYDDPLLDLGAARLLTELGRTQDAAREVRRIRRRWGSWPGLDRLAIVLAAEKGADAVRTAVAGALERAPSNLQLRTLAWREGLESFFAPFQVNALQVAASRKEASSGVDSELILDQAVERVFADGSSLYYYHGLTRALTPDGVKEAATIPLLPGAVLVRVRIIKADGSIVVPPDVNADNPSVTLKDVAPGDMVEHEYVAPVGPAGASRKGHLSPYIYRFADPNRSFGRSEYVLLVPKEIRLDVDGNFTGLDYEDREEDGLRMVSWRATSVPPVPDEPYSPPTQQILPWVSYGFGVSWEDVADSVRDRVLPALAGSPELWRWAAPLLAEPDPRAALHSLVDALTDEVAAGDGDFSVRSTAGESFSEKRGNRMAILAAVLVHAGWRVDLVLTRPAAFVGTGLKAPNFTTFPTPVLRVGKGDFTSWIDTAEDRRGVDHIRPILQGSDGYVLPLSNPGSPVAYLKSLPRFANPGLEEVVHLEARVEGSGAADLRYEIVLRGGQGERLLKLVNTVPTDRVGMVYRQVAAGLFPGAEQVRGSVTREQGGVVLRLELRLPGACAAAAGGLECRNLVMSRPLSPKLAALPSRHFPLVLQLPIRQRLELELRPPEGWKAEGGERKLKSTWGEVSEDLSAEDGVWRSILKLRIPAQVVATDRYPEFVRFCHAVDELMSRPPRLVKGER